MRLAGQVEDERSQDGDAHTRDHQVDRVEELLAANVQVVGDVDHSGIGNKKS
jgi:hypothetical protein